MRHACTAALFTDCCALVYTDTMVSALTDPADIAHTASMQVFACLQTLRS